MKTYSVDGHLGLEGLLISEPLEVEAKSNKEAVKKWLESKGINLDKVKIEYGGKNAQVQSLAFKIGNDGRKYADGRATWWTVYKKID